MHCVHSTYTHLPFCFWGLETCTDFCKNTVNEQTTKIDSAWSSSTVWPWFIRPHQRNWISFDLYLRNYFAAALQSDKNVIYALWTLFVGFRFDIPRMSTLSLCALFCKFTSNRFTHTYMKINIYIYGDGGVIGAYRVALFCVQIKWWMSGRDFRQKAAFDFIFDWYRSIYTFGPRVYYPICIYMVIHQCESKNKQITEIRNDIWMLECQVDFAGPDSAGC